MSEGKERLSLNSKKSSVSHIHTPVIQVTQVTHPDIGHDDNSQGTSPAESTHQRALPTLGIDNPTFEQDDLPSVRSVSTYQGEADELYTPQPTPLPIPRGSNPSVFVFDSDTASLYSRRGSYSIGNVTPLPTINLPRRGSSGQTDTISGMSSLTVPHYRKSRIGDHFDGHGLKADHTTDGPLPPPSPALLSTNSAWSELMKLGTSRRTSVGGNSEYSRVSNVSSSLSEHLRYLVRAFSSRTERVKETTLQPLSPASSVDSLSDCVSAISAEIQVRHRLDSFFPDVPEGDTISEIVRIQEEQEKSKKKKFKVPKWIRKLKFPHVIEPQSKLYLLWLFIVTLAFMYNAWAIPLRGVFPYQTEANLKYWLTMDYICDGVYIIDILLFKMRITFLNQGLKETHRKATRANYMKKHMFKFDLLSLLPLDLFSLLTMHVNPWYRLPRLMKIQTFWEFYSRCDHLVRSAHALRILKTMTYMLFLIHVETCGYYAMSVYEGIGVNEWVYDGDGIAYVRCLYLATKTATSIGNNPKPQNTNEFMFMTVYWVSGVFVFALLIGQIRDIVDAANMQKTMYTKKMDAALNYVKNMNLPKDTQKRVRTWFIYNWQQQKFLDERVLMEALPMKLRKDLAIHVHFNTLSKVKLFQDCDKTLLYDLVLKLKPILYLPGDYVCKKGEIGKEMYIVSQGIVEVVGGPDNVLVLATLKEGSVFGEISLLAMAAEGNRRTADVRCKGFTNLFILSKNDFEAAMKDYPDAHSLLKKRAKKLLKVNARLQKQSQASIDRTKLVSEVIIQTPPGTPKMVKTVIQVLPPGFSVMKHLHSRSAESIASRDKENEEDDAVDEEGTDNRAYEPGSEYNIVSKTDAPTVQEVEDFFDEILSSRDLGIGQKESEYNLKKYEQDRSLEIGAFTDDDDIDDVNRHGNTDDKKKNSASSTDSGVQDTKITSPTPSSSRTISNKDSKESFMSVCPELGDILEDSDGSHTPPTMDGINYILETVNEDKTPTKAAVTAPRKAGGLLMSMENTLAAPAGQQYSITPDMFGDIESHTHASSCSDRADSPASSIPPRSMSSGVEQDEYLKSFASGFTIKVESADDCINKTRNVISAGRRTQKQERECDSVQEKREVTEGQNEIKVVETIADVDHTNVSRRLSNKIPQNIEDLISPDNTPREVIVVPDSKHKDASNKTKDVIGKSKVSGLQTQPKQFGVSNKVGRTESQSKLDISDTQGIQKGPDSQNVRLVKSASAKRTQTKQRPKTLPKKPGGQKVQPDKQKAPLPNASPYTKSSPLTKHKPVQTNNKKFSLEHKPLQVNSAKHSLEHNPLQANSTKATVEPGKGSLSNSISKPPLKLSMNSQARTITKTNIAHESSNDLNHQKSSAGNTRSIQVVEANDSDSVDNVPINNATIPSENQVTFVAEVHREKTLSPTLMAPPDDSLSVTLSQEMTNRQRKISVISIGSVLKDSRETLV